MKKSHPRKKVGKVSSRKTSRKTIKKTSKRNRVISSRNRFFKQEIYTGPFQAPPIPPVPKLPPPMFESRFLGRHHLPPPIPPVPKLPPPMFESRFPGRHHLPPPIPPKPHRFESRFQGRRDLPSINQLKKYNPLDSDIQLPYHANPYTIGPDEIQLPIKPHGFFSNLYNKHKYSQNLKRSAFQLLNTKDRNTFTKECNELVKIGGNKNVYKEFQRAESPERVKALCTNLAQKLLV
jgi:hypothetical protein